MMRMSVALLTATLLTGSLVACTSGYGVPPTASISTDSSAQTHVKVLPVELRSSEILAKMHAGAGLGRPDAVKPGIYASEYSGYVYGYAGNNRSNSPPVCSIGPAAASYDVAVDPKGDVLFVDRTAQNTSRIIIYAGPGLCGPELGSIADPYGLIVDVASRDAQTGKIVVANYLGNNLANGNVAVCTLSGGCTLELNQGAHWVNGVALAPNGDCWAAGQYPRTLTYFARCRRPGVTATGFQGRFPSGLDIDDDGNLVAVETLAHHHTGSMYIYSGCNPACTLVGGPFPLHGNSLYGHLNASSKRFVAADQKYRQLDVYSYSTSGITYEYSISNGLTDDLWGAAFSPSSKE
jgi:hypothetical protein